LAGAADGALAIGVPSIGAPALRQPYAKSCQGFAEGMVRTAKVVIAGPSRKLSTRSPALSPEQISRLSELTGT
jgi:hypothetical protein